MKKLSFPCIKINKPLPLPVYIEIQKDSNLEVNPSPC